MNECIVNDDDDFKQRFVCISGRMVLEIDGMCWWSGMVGGISDI